MTTNWYCGECGRNHPDGYQHINQAAIKAAASVLTEGQPAENCCSEYPNCKGHSGQRMRLPSPPNTYPPAFGQTLEVKTSEATHPQDEREWYEPFKAWEQTLPAYREGWAADDRAFKAGWQAALASRISMAYDFEREMGIEERREAAELAQQGKVCPNCEAHGGVSTTWFEVTEAGVTYMAPFNSCGNCQFQYTDYEYEDAQERAFRAARRGN